MWMRIWIPLLASALLTQRRLLGVIGPNSLARNKFHDFVMRRKLSWNERMQKFCCTLPHIQAALLWLSYAKASAEVSVLGRLSQTLNSAIRYLDISSVQRGTTKSPWILLFGQSYIGFTTGEHESVGSIR